VENLCRGRQATDDNIIQHMRIACWITKATDTHSEYVYLLLLHGNNGYTNVLQCYVIRTLPVLLKREYIVSKYGVKFHSEKCFNYCLTEDIKVQCDTFGSGIYV
jgi:hypothetical protein